MLLVSIFFVIGKTGIEISAATALDPSVCPSGLTTDLASIYSGTDTGGLLAIGQHTFSWLGSQTHSPRHVAGDGGKRMDGVRHGRTANLV